MNSGEDILLKVNGLTTVFQTEGGLFKAVDNISFELKKGEVLGIVGESGSGKSVTSSFTSIQNHSESGIKIRAAKPAKKES